MKITIGTTEYSDSNDNIEKYKEGVRCGCGNDMMKLISHIDGINWYAFEGQCTKCGNLITTTTQRDKDDPMYWDGGDYE